jgi:hypothetical protein
VGPVRRGMGSEPLRLLQVASILMAGASVLALDVPIAVADTPEEHASNVCAIGEPGVCVPGFISSLNLHHET